jgi:hypothetical protein
MHESESEWTIAVQKAFKTITSTYDGSLQRPNVLIEAKLLFTPSSLLLLMEAFKYVVPYNNMTTLEKERALDMVVEVALQYANESEGYVFSREKIELLVNVLRLYVQKRQESVETHMCDKTYYLYSLVLDLRKLLSERLDLHAVGQNKKV